MLDGPGNRLETQESGSKVIRGTEIPQFLEQLSLDTNPTNKANGRRILKGFEEYDFNRIDKDRHVEEGPSKDEDHYKTIVSPEFVYGIVDYKSDSIKVVKEIDRSGAYESDNPKIVDADENETKAYFDNYVLLQTKNGNLVLFTGDFARDSADEELSNAGDRIDAIWNNAQKLTSLRLKPQPFLYINEEDFAYSLGEHPLDITNLQQDHLSPLIIRSPHNLGEYEEVVSPNELIGRETVRNAIENYQLVQGIRRNKLKISPEVRDLWHAADQYIQYERHFRPLVQVQKERLISSFRRWKTSLGAEESEINEMLEWLAEENYKLKELDGDSPAIAEVEGAELPFFIREGTGIYVGKLLDGKTRQEIIEEGKKRINLEDVNSLGLDNYYFDLSSSDMEEVIPAILAFVQERFGLSIQEIIEGASKFGSEDTIGRKSISSLFNNLDLDYKEVNTEWLKELRR